MADLLTISVGNLFTGAIVPGLLLAFSYFVYVIIIAKLKPEIAPPLLVDENTLSGKPFYLLFLKGFVPPVFLISLVLGSIFGGWATPTEAAGIGAFGALVLALAKGKLTRSLLH